MSGNMGFGAEEEWIFRIMMIEYAAVSLRADIFRFSKLLGFSRFKHLNNFKSISI